MNSNKVKLTPVLVPMRIQPHDGDLVKLPNGSLGIYTETGKFDSGQSQQLLLVSNRPIEPNTPYALDMSGLTDTKNDIEIMMCNDDAEAKRCNDKTGDIGRSSKRIEAAYPELPGIPQIVLGDMQLCCDEECYFKREEDGGIQTPRTESGFIVLQMEQKDKVINTTSINEDFENAGVQLPEQGNNPIDSISITSDELINGLENMPDFSGRNADAQGEVMDFPAWFKSNYKGQSHHDFAQNRLCTEYAIYYHTTLSQQPEQKAEGMSAESAKYAYGVTGNKSGQVQMRYPDYTKEIKDAFLAGAAYKQADKVVDWEKIEKEFLDWHIKKCIDEVKPNGKGFISTAEYFYWFKSRLSTSGVSDGEKVANINESNDFKNFM